MNKQIIKEFLGEQYNENKNYESIVSKINEDERVNNNKIIKYVIIPICLALILVVSLTIINKINNNNNTHLYSKNDIASTIFEESKDYKLEININKVNDMGLLKIDADLKLIDIFEKIIDAVEKPSDINIINKYNFIKKIKLPSSMSLRDSYAVYIKKDNSSINYDILHEYKLVYVNNDDTKNITISFSEEFKPLRDYYFYDKNMLVSTINTTNLIISNYGEYHMAIYENAGLNFDIETKGLSQEEVVELLKSIII